MHAFLSYPVLNTGPVWQCPTIPAEIVPSDGHTIALTTLGYVHLRVLSCTALFPGHLNGRVGCSAWGAQATRGEGGGSRSIAGPPWMFECTVSGLVCAPRCQCLIHSCMHMYAHSRCRLNHHYHQVVRAVLYRSLGNLQDAGCRQIETTQI